MNVPRPRYIANFDSTTAMLQIISNYLKWLEHLDDFLAEAQGRYQVNWL